MAFFRRMHRFFKKELSWEDVEIIKETVAASSVEKDGMKAK